jgi:hypothetical protein
MDDEWHAVHKLLHAGYLDIATHFGGADYCIPLTLFYKGLSDTIGLTELGMRGLPFCFGVFFLIAAPLAARRLVEPFAADLFAWLVALSPQLIYFSRVARPYALTVALASIAFVSFYAWRRRGGNAWAIAYIASAVLAVYLHLVILPYIAAPFVYYFLRDVLRQRDGQTWWRLCGVGLVFVLLSAALVAPPLWVDWSALQGKAGVHSIELDTVRATGVLMFGVRSSTLAFFVLLPAVIGTVKLYRTRTEWTQLVLTAAALELAALIITRPAWINHGAVLVRYMMPALPPLLLALAVGVGVLVGRLLRSPWHANAVVLAASALLFISGPLPATYYYPNNFTNHSLFYFDYRTHNNPIVDMVFDQGPIPPFYDQLGALPRASIRIAEAPYQFESYLDDYPRFQYVHRQRVLLGFIAPLCSPPRLGEVPDDGRVRLRNAVNLASDAQLRAKRVRYVIFHRGYFVGPERRNVLPDTQGCVASFRSRYGPPVYADQAITVFDLAPQVPRAANDALSARGG